MMITMWVDGSHHEVPAEHVVPWVCGVNGRIDTVDFGPNVTVDVDPATSDRPGIVYLVEVDGKRYELADSWVLPWVRGLAIHHGADARDVCDPDAAERAQRVQALMVGHQRGWFTYTGFSNTTRED